MKILCFLILTFNFLFSDESLIKNYIDSYSWLLPYKINSNTTLKDISFFKKQSKEILYLKVSLDKEYISIEEKISLFNNSKVSNKKFLCLNNEIKEILNNNSLIYIKVEDKNGEEIFTERYKKDSCNFI